MGKQLLLHMLQDDRNDLFSYLNSSQRLNAALWTSASPELKLEEKPETEARSMAIWPSDSGRHISRRKVSRDDGSEVFEFDRTMGLLEWEPSKIVERAGKPALLQGRLYLFATDVDPQMAVILRRAVHWVRKTYEACPVKSFGGFVGPSAMRWFREGGVLLPMFSPPLTENWEQLISEQHGSLRRLV